MMNESGRLIHGDNLRVLAEHVDNGSVDLVYVDPPFNSGARYLVAGAVKGEGFSDTWRWDACAADAWASAVEAATPAGAALKALRDLLGEGDLLAYLTMMAPRLEALRVALCETGSIYLHCDGAASHYLKVLMDAVFGRACFLNNIVWLYGLGGSSPRYWPRKHDDILWYARTAGKQQFEAATVPALSLRMRGQRKKAPDWWDIPALNNMARERTGYPTQKPEALLERIVASSSRPGDVVLDPCCGSGTTLVVADRLGRRWIGIDSSQAAIEVAGERLRRTCATMVRTVDPTQERHSCP